MVHIKHRRKLSRRILICATLLIFAGSIALSKVRELPDSNLASIAEITSEFGTDPSAEGPLAEAVAAFLKGEAAQDDIMKVSALP